MTNRKFTPPTEFPAEYVDGYGCKVTILGRSYYNKERPLVGFDDKVTILGRSYYHKERPLVGFDDEGCACNYAENGAYWPDDEGKYDLHDIQKRITTWHNVYEGWVGASNKVNRGATENRLCVYRIERNEDGSNPEIFVEEV